MEARRETELSLSWDEWRGVYWQSLSCNSTEEQILLAKNGRIFDASVICDLLTYWFTVVWKYSCNLIKKYPYKEMCKHICIDVIHSCQNIVSTKTQQGMFRVTRNLSSYSWKNKRIVLLSRAILQIIILICLNSSNICQLFIFSDWLSR